MMKRLFPLFLSLLLLSACTSPQSREEAQEDTSLSLVTTTYPVYLFLSEVTRGAEGVHVTPLINQSVSCLHDYTLTVNEMKILENADKVFLNGGSLDLFVEETIQKSNPQVQTLDCGTALDVWQQDGRDTPDPHYWMDPTRATAMLETIAADLVETDPQNAELYQRNATAAAERLRAAYETLKEKLAPLSTRQIITFHDGFAYFAKSFDLDLVLAVEEEEGQEASAQVIATALDLIDEYSLSAIFTEEFSADATAQAIAREAGIEVHKLSLIMSGETENVGIDQYIQAMERNIDTILEAYT